MSQGSDRVVDGDSGGGLRGGPVGPPKAGKPAKGVAGKHRQHAFGGLAWS